MCPKILKGSNRRYYNIHRITKEIVDKEDRFNPLDRRIKNLEVKCLRCGYIQILTIQSAFKGGVYCAKCGATIKANPLIMNYRMNKTRIINYTSKPAFQIGGFRVKSTK